MNDYVWIEAPCTVCGSEYVSRETWKCPCEEVALAPESAPTPTPRHYGDNFIPGDCAYCGCKWADPERWECPNCGAV